MEPLTSPRVLKDLLNRHGFHFTKSLGQNFLIDENILQKLITSAGIRKEDNVLEIGPGVGTMTRALAAAARRVTAVEIDKRLLPILKETLQGYSNVSVVLGDILKMDLSALTAKAFDGEPYMVVANLPYYITTPILMAFLESEQIYSALVIMVQREVARRMAALPGSKDYGALSVAVQYHTIPRVLCSVPASVFMPPPKVDSMVIALEKRKVPAVDVPDRRLFFSVVRAAFAQRRKTLLNTLGDAGLYPGTKADLRVFLEEIGISPERRGETLDLEEYADITRALVTK